MNTKNKATQYIPYAIAGAGIAWAIANHQKKSKELAEEVRDRADDMKDEAQHLTNRLVNGTKDAASKAKDKVQNWSETASEKSEEAIERVRTFAEEKPLVVGSGILAASALLGWLAPQSRDEVKDKVRRGVREAIDSALTKGREIVNVAADEAKVAAEEARQNIASKMSA